MLEAAGYPDKPGALSQVAAKCGISHQLLSNWARAAHNPPPQEVLQEKRLELKDMLKAEIDGALAAMPMARVDATYRDLGTVAAILIDKLQLLEGKATERVEVNELSDTDRATRIAALLDRAGARRDGRADSETIH